MILVDANLLLYAYMNAHPQHSAARQWLNDQINGPTLVGLPWQSLLALIRICTNPRVYARPATVDAVCLQVEEWLSLDAVWIPHPGGQHANLLISLLRATGARGNLTSDAHIAALAMEHGLTLCSSDRDFARFPGLRWIDPLA